MLYWNFLYKIYVTLACFLSALLSCLFIVLHVTGLNFQRFGKKNVQKVNEENDSD